MTMRRFRSLELLSFCVAGWFCVGSQSQAQDVASLPANASSGQPVVIHIHHHHYYSNPSSLGAEMASFYSPTYAWNYGLQPGTGRLYEPWMQNWGHLGFTGYIGQHGGGVDPTLHVFTGLVVDTVTLGSPASKIGLVPGDFILKINGTPVDSYKQVTILFDQTLEGAKPEVELTVWNPHTRRTSTLTAILEKN